jgi:nitric oxide dioxygenase
MLSEKTIAIIKTTVPALQQHANAITEHFYPLLFKQYPEVLPYFNQTNQGKGTQPKALANAVVAYGANIDELGNLSEAVQAIVQKHCSLGIQPEQYAAVGDCLLQAITAVLGAAATEEIIDAWGQAYGQLAEILIAAEERVYADTAQQAGGWRGEREFKVVKKVDESEVITSFYLEPSDGAEVMSFKPGQYITLLLNIDGQAMRRSYSLSDAPDTGYLRISVKREPNGAVSNYLHDKLQQGDSLKILAPCGDFFLRQSDKPLVLVTAGVGITPAISMLNVAANSDRTIHFIHAALNSQSHAFKEHVDQLSCEHKGIQTLYVYSDPSAECQPHATGFISKELIATQMSGINDVDYYFLGPKPFMQSALTIAKELGVPDSQVHYEFFGPKEDLVA